MPLWRSLGARKDATRGTAAIEVRKSLEGLFSGPGVVVDSATPVVTGTAGWAYMVNAAHFVTKRGVADGVHLFGNDGPVSVGATGVGSTVPAAPGGGLSRVDIIWVRHRSANENGDTTSEPDFGVTSGTAGSPGVAPAIPTGALELARNVMTSGATSTASAGNTIAQTAAAARLRGQQQPYRAVRAAEAVLNIDGWRDASEPFSYTFVAGGWYQVTAIGTVSIGGGAAALRHWLLVDAFEVSPEYQQTMLAGELNTITAHFLFKAPSTSPSTVRHQLHVSAPATGIVVRPGHTVFVTRVA